MQITGKNLLLVHQALLCAMSDLRNEIATCPDVVEYAEDLEEIEATIVQFEKLLERVKKHTLPSGGAA